MGAGLSIVSSKHIPNPKNYRSELEQLGFEFGELIDQDQMIEVNTFPGGWGYICISNRGDIWFGYLMNKGVAKYSLDWVSKGSYDNYTRFSKMKIPKRLLDSYDLVDHQYAISTSDQNVVDRLNSYHEAQYRGLSQKELDEMYDDLQRDLVNYPHLETERLIAQKLENALQDATTAIGVTFRKPYSTQGPRFENVE